MAARVNAASIKSRWQRGAALMVMLIILILGLTTLMVKSLSTADISNERQAKTADALAHAKDALIGRATLDANLPGSLPCPDTDGDGFSELLSGNDCPSYIGQFPWKTLELPELQDGTGGPLWYALSRNFRDDNSAHPINSEMAGTLNISGTQTASNVTAIVFAPDAPLGTQQRSTAVTMMCATLSGTTTQSNCAINYLEGTNATLSTAASTNLNYQTANPSVTFNDQLIAVTREQLFQPVEMRIAREVKKCLDDYASANGNRYPWAADPTDTSFYYSKSNTLFGRLPRQQTPDSNVQNLIDSISALQTAVTNCANGVGNQGTLVSTGGALKNAAKTVRDNQPTSPPIPTSVTTPARTAGDKAKDADVTCADIQADPTGNAIQTNLDSAVNALSTLPPTFAWPASCTLFSSAYWPDWRNQVFYQIDPQYKPGGALGIPSITINGAGAGNYRAVVAVARSPLNGGPIRNPSDQNTYLEAGNQHTNPTPSSAFSGYSITDPLYKSVNDLVVCLDGQVNCK